MLEQQLSQLEKVGLSTAEAQIYLALVRNGGALSASAIVAATGVPRSSVYPTLTRLTDLGCVEAEAGYGGRFSAIPAEHALSYLIVREREELSRREQVARELSAQLKPVTDAVGTNGGEAELIQVLRDPRVIAERFERLELEAERQIEVFCKAPVFVRAGNPSQAKAMRRGVHYRGLYERAIVDAPEVEPYLSSWITAGEEARIYEGDLPHKLAIFDRQNILMPLPTSSGNGRTLFIRNPQLAMSLGMLFDFLWEKATPLLRPKQKGGGNQLTQSHLSMPDRNGRNRKNQIHKPSLGGQSNKPPTENERRADISLTKRKSVTALPKH